MYNKLFTRILDSSIWLEPAPTRLVWITLLAAMDRTGYAHFSAIGNLASRARVTDQEAQQAIDAFTSPDNGSGDPDNEGRRVERVPGGYMILNANKYRALATAEDMRAKTAMRVEKHRRLQGTIEPESEPQIPPAASTSPPLNGPIASAAPVPRAENVSGGEILFDPDDFRSKVSPPPPFCQVDGNVEKVADRIGKMQGRVAKLTRWPYEDQHGLSQILSRPELEKELGDMEAAKTRYKFFPRSVTSLLRQWDKTLEEIRDPNNQPKKTGAEKAMDREVRELVAQAERSEAKYKKQTP